MKIEKYLTLLAALVAAPVVATTNEATAAQVRQVATNFRELDDGVAKVKDAIEGYNGGMLAALQVANSIYGAHKATSSARNEIKNGGNFTLDDGAQALDAYKDLHPRLVDKLQTAKTKAPVFRKAGYGYVAQGMMANLYMEKNSFDQALREKMPEEEYKQIAPFTDELDKAVQDVISMYQDY